MVGPRDEQVLPPSGIQVELRGGGYHAVVTECGAGLRSLAHDGRALIDGYAEDQMAFAGRGQILMPWPNRIRDGRYTCAGRDLQLGLTEAGRRNASHGLVRWVSWQVAEQEPDRVRLAYRLMAQSGYPWTLDLQVTYELDGTGLAVTQRAVNRSSEPAAYASGAHPYLVAGSGPVDGWELLLPGATRLLTDPDRKLPTGTEPVQGTGWDFRTARAIGGLELDHAYTDLARDADGTVHLELRDPAEGTGVAMWGDTAVRWLQVYTADDQGATARRSLAAEPMTAPPDAFNSGVDLVLLEPGAAYTARWGIRAL